MKKVICAGALLTLSACVPAYYNDPGYAGYGGYTAPAYQGYGYAPNYGGGAVFEFNEANSYRRAPRLHNRPEYFHAEPHFAPHAEAHHEEHAAHDTHPDPHHDWSHH